MGSQEKALDEAHITTGLPERAAANTGASASHGIVNVASGSPPPEPDLEEVALTQLMRLNAIVTGIVTGLIAGLGLFIATNWLVLKGGDEVGPHLSLLAQFFIGYTVTFAGSFVGFTYAFVVGFAVGFAVAWLYNLLVDQPRSGRETGDRKR